MLDEDCASCKSSDKIDFGMVEKVVVLSLESRMWLLLDLENHITRLNPRGLVALAPELNLVSCSDTSVDVNVVLSKLPLSNCCTGLCSAPTTHCVYKI